MIEDRFPRIWVPDAANRDLRQLLWHRHRMVQARTRIMNQLQAVALNEGLRCKKRLWRERGRQQLESFQLAPWASRRRRDLLELMDRLNPMIAGTEPGDRAGSREVSRSTTADDASRCRSAHRTGLRTDHRRSRALSVWQAVGELSRTGAARRLQRESPPTGTHYQARQFHAALFTRGSGAGYSAQPATMAQSISST